MTKNQNPIPTEWQVKHSLRGLKHIDQESAEAPQSFEGQLERLARVYASVKPLLTMLAAVPLLPPMFRKAITYLGAAIEAVAAGVSILPVSFKAGKDL
jgi:hypothetical protein